MSNVNFDPNMNYSGRMSEKTVRLVFGLWDYRAEFTRKVRGNCSGLTNIRSAVDSLTEELWEGGVVLKRPNGDELQDCNEDQSDDWLHDMLIEAQITDIQPYS
jgi:hypothetical protein